MERIKKKKCTVQKMSVFSFCRFVGVSIYDYDDFIYSCSCTLFVRVRARDHGGLNARLISGYEHVIN